jgi:hypothetical protein
LERSEALKSLGRDRRIVPDGEEYAASYFEPSDGPGVARLFYTVYGDGYPIDTYYIPERLAEENRCGNIRSVVSRTVSGNVVSHVALYRSSPPNPNLYEHGVGLTLPGYRSTMAFYRANLLLMKLVGQDGIDGIFGEAVCNHVTSQKLSEQSQCLATAAEPALMPARSYQAEQSAAGRVGCLLFSRVDRDRRRVLHLPAAYCEEVTWLLEGLNLDRELVAADQGLPGNDCKLDIKRFDFAGVARCTVTVPGADLALRLAELERELQKGNYALNQVFIDLGKPWSGNIVEHLRDHGYSLGGLLPIWFGSDGLLMQKHFVNPDFDGMQVCSQRGRDVLKLVKHDWERSQGVW